MNRKLKNFLYSQNSINTYKSCPLKFKYKYIDKVNWKQDDENSRAYYENLKLGTDFHLICERYFSNIPTGIEHSQNYDFNLWLDKVKRLIPLNEEYIYLPEYEVRYKLDDVNIQAKYDLVIISDNKISIWDWKTENRKLDYNSVENRMQTIIYLFLAAEVIPNIHNRKIDYTNININYYQPEYYNEPITIKYSEEKHTRNRENIKNYINTITETCYEDEISLKNDKHCKFCEFNKLCNNKDINYEVWEEEVYES
ncbi:MAG: PD-(D/E)XK nuclease family protein [Paraclostridium sp.]